MNNTDRPAVSERFLALLPRGVIILVGFAAGVVVVAGMRQVTNIIAPLFLALCLTVTVYPLRTWLERHSCPKWLATLLVILGVYAILIGLVASMAWGVARLATLLPSYVPQMQSSLQGIEKWLSGLGIGKDQIQQALSKISPGTLLNFVGSIVSSLLSITGLFVLVIALVLFMSIDTAGVPARVSRYQEGRTQVIAALGAFAVGTRKYFVVSTIFGGIVAIGDGIALAIMGVPAAFLWALLAFVTNYIPNIGFIIGLVPPALLALLTGGVGQMVAVIIVYCVLNLVIQSVLQPKFVADAVSLTTTVSFLSLIVWAYAMGPLGAILAVPMTLLVKAVLVDFDPRARWLQLFLGDEPDLRSRKERKAAAAPAKPGGESGQSRDTADEPVPEAG